MSNEIEALIRTMTSKRDDLLAQAVKYDEAIRAVAPLIPQITDFTPESVSSAPKRIFPRPAPTKYGDISVANMIAQCVTHIPADYLTIHRAIEQKFGCKIKAEAVSSGLSGVAAKGRIRSSGWVNGRKTWVLASHVNGAA